MACAARRSAAMPDSTDQASGSARDLDRLRIALHHLAPDLVVGLKRKVGRPPVLHVTNPSRGRFSEDISVRPGAADGLPGCFLWSWGQPAITA